MKKLDAESPETKSADIVAGNVEALKALFPEAFTEGRIDFEALKGMLGAAVDERDEKYGLNWHGKRRARQIALTPSTGTLLPCPEESVDWDTTQNLMIEGDNLEVLKLLQKSYSGKVKLIYIDPPYNTGKDFVYPDDFRDSIKNYLELTGQVEGGKKIGSNTDASGRYHTDWLNMIYPRLYLARSLLKSSGAIAISIGETELGNLSRACNEIFGEENLVTICSRVMKTGGQKGVHFSPCVDYILIYARDISSLAPFRSEISQNVIDKVYTKVETTGPRKGQNYRSMGLYQAMLDARANQRYYIRCPDGEMVIPPGISFPEKQSEGEQTKPNDGDGVWRWTYARYKSENENSNIEFIKSDRTSLVKHNGEKASWNVYYKIWLNDRLEDGQLPGNILEKFESRHSSAELKKLEIPFEFAKPTALIKFLMSVCGVKDGELTLDFFAGSGSSAHAAVELAAETGSPRPFICVQLPEPTAPDSEEHKSGYQTITDLTKERIRRAVKSIQASNPMFSGDTGFRVFKLASSNIRAWEPDAADLENSLLKNAEHLVQGRNGQDVLYELLLKLGLDLCVPIEAKTIAGKSVHAVGGGALIVCLTDGLTKDVIEPLASGIVAWRKALAPAVDTRVVFKDSGFADDIAKTNIAAILNQNGITDVRSL
jgi:adenine-specific DNA-methyltransferase